MCLFSRVRVSKVIAAVPSHRSIRVPSPSLRLRDMCFSTSSTPPRQSHSIRCIREETNDHSLLVAASNWVENCVPRGSPPLYYRLRWWRWWFTTPHPSGTPRRRLFRIQCAAGGMCLCLDMYMDYTIYIAVL